MKLPRASLSSPLFLIVGLLACGSQAPAPAHAPATQQAAPAALAFDWQEQRIAWLSHEQAFARARAEGKPVLALFYATWCPTSAGFVRDVLASEAVIAASQRFAMLRVDIDTQDALHQALASDLKTVPSIAFFNPAGQRLDAFAEREDEHYGFFEDEPSLLRGMERALVAGPAASLPQPKSEPAAAAAEEAPRAADNDSLDQSEMDRRRPRIEPLKDALVAVCQGSARGTPKREACAVLIAGMVAVPFVQYHGAEAQAEAQSECERGDCGSAIARAFWGVPPLKDPALSEAVRLAASGCEKAKSDLACEYPRLLAAIQQHLGATR